jgi:hypothetical protein
LFPADLIEPLGLAVEPVVQPLAGDASFVGRLNIFQLPRIILDAGVALRIVKDCIKHCDQPIKFVVGDHEWFLAVALLYPSSQPRASGYLVGMTLELDEFGTVYPTARIVDAWGVLTVTDGALIDKNWSGVTVAAPRDAADAPHSGPGWTLELSDGWMVIAATRSGVFELHRKP